MDGRESPDPPLEGDLQHVQRTRGLAAAQRMIRERLAGGVWNPAEVVDEEAEPQDDNA